MSSDPLYAVDPFVGPQDHLLRGASWEEVDRAAARAIGRACLAVPSVRVAMSWTLEHLGLGRHRDHVLVPRFTSRCILTTLARRALPVEEPTTRTRLAVVVHQYGLRQQLASIASQCADRGVPYVEDAAYGPDREEGLGPGSLARFIGLTKTLPVLKGAVVLSDDESLLQSMRRRRMRTTAWSLAVFAALSYLRANRSSSGHSDLAELAYEMYEAAGGDHRWTRGNILLGLKRLHAIGTEASRRRDQARAVLGSDLVTEQSAVTPYVGVLLARELDQLAVAFRRSGFDGARYHIDVARDLFQPRYEQALLVPFNPRIPAAAFDGLLHAVGPLARGTADRRGS